MAPTILVFALINPLGWLLFATGEVGRSLNIEVLTMVTVVTGYALGLSSGPKGFALGFSDALTLFVVPIVVWSRPGTLITSWDAARAAMPSVGSVAAGAPAPLLLWPWIQVVEPPLVRLTLTSGLVLGVHLAMLLCAFKDRQVFMRLFAEAGIWPARR